MIQIRDWTSALPGTKGAIGSVTGRRPPIYFIFDLYIKISKAALNTTEKLENKAVIQIKGGSL